MKKINLKNINIPKPIGPNIPNEIIIHITAYIQKSNVFFAS